MGKKGYNKNEELVSAPSFISRVMIRTYPSGIFPLLPVAVSSFRFLCGIKSFNKLFKNSSNYY